MLERTRLAVWGDPIGHSRSPALHRAAYAHLGLAWSYDRRQVDAAGFDAALDGLDDAWRGLSLTMPLKEAAFRRSVRRDRHAALTGAVNTLLLGEETLGCNTDVGGIVDALVEQSITRVGTARILGAGATAASALVAVAELDARCVEVRARRPEVAANLRPLAAQLGVELTVTDFAASAPPVDLTVATLPSGTVLADAAVDPLVSAGGALFEAAYAPWPSALVARWDGPVISGFAMLLHQAVRQIRVFRHGDAQQPLPDEDALVAVMRDAVRL